VNVALYSTSWLAMVLFVAGEAGKVRADANRSWPWPWHFSIAGAVICAIHVLIAMGFHHGWDHDHAIRETVDRTAAIYGYGWRGGLYVNYVFILVWAADTLWYGARPSGYYRRPVALTWLIRVFLAVVAINGMVVFASPAGRFPGIVLWLWLVWVWRSRASPPATRTTRSYRGP
jgi:hypothetical protein